MFWYALSERGMAMSRRHITKRIKPRRRNRSCSLIILILFYCNWKSVRNVSWKRTIFDTCLLTTYRLNIICWVHDSASYRHPGPIITRHWCGKLVEKILNVSRFWLRELKAFWYSSCCFQWNEKPGSRSRLKADHDHVTGKVRSLLCSNCNQALGSLKEDPERVNALLRYIKQYIV